MKLKSIVLLAAFIVVLSAPLLRAGEKPTQQERLAMEQVVREYILQHPEIIAEAANLYQEHERKAHQQKVKEGVTAKSKELRDDPSSPTTGAPRGVTVVEFFDYHCGYCRRVEPTIQKLLAAHPEIKLVFKEFPSLGPESMLAAKASLAANEQGGYLPFHRALMAHSGSIDMRFIEELAAKNGLDAARLKADMESTRVSSRIAANAELGRSVGVAATPTFVVGSEVVQGAIDQATLERLISEAKPTNPDLASATR